MLAVWVMASQHQTLTGLTVTGPAFLYGFGGLHVYEVIHETLGDFFSVLVTFLTFEGAIESVICLIIKK